MPVMMLLAPVSSRVEPHMEHRSPFSGTQSFMERRAGLHDVIMRSSSSSYTAHAERDFSLK